MDHQSRKTFTTIYSGLSKFYFLAILKAIINLGNLKKTNKNILDFGCGSQMLSKILNNNKVFNYDINPKYSDYSSYENLEYDIVVINQVFMYLSYKNIEDFLKQELKKNPNVIFIVGISKMNNLSKLGSKIFYNKNPQEGIQSSYKNQLSILLKYLDIINSKKNIFYLTDVFVLKFKLSYVNLL